MYSGLWLTAHSSHSPSHVTNRCSQDAVDRSRDRSQVTVRGLKEEKLEHKEREGLAHETVCNEDSEENRYKHVSHSDRKEEFRPLIYPK